ncbi:AFR729Cp [Eremothecium gossypii ATCC 10895]|uniref:AFR729Cp n=1 Tax=Eremothecium gossypii (strain ATCC 10895 / CBS 109.51 / FGSC 9923 / NRRL Y-1056) TaxID=284811 RepID=Q751U6_EREGS|nr:AFR729Cp [Eremothecium gossypii ATCC 10895]AAS54101.2 AFR729Cp [Eremothecium gossypii ATCC 10895]AEY98417.1 FAFR729Cp [Eremothecium gossypii FDAG1]
MSKDIEYPCAGWKEEGLLTIAIDIGGSLAKLVFAPPESNKLIFETVETEKLDEFIRLLHEVVERYNKGDYGSTMIVATGGGAFKFYDVLLSEFPGVSDILRLDEMDCLTKGLDFFIHKVPYEVFTYNDLDGEGTVDAVADDEMYPYMLVNIGSGVSILKVESPNECMRVGGSSLGGGTLWGLLSLITGAKTYDEMLAWANQGNNANVDMLVGDIYGTDYAKIGLKSSNIASSFGKVFQRESVTAPSAGLTSASATSTCEIRDRNEKFSNADISKSLLYAISNNIGQIAYLQAKIHNVKKIYFGGSYIRGHLTTMNTLSYAINFWSKGSKQAFFLRHEGYLGAMGAFLAAQKK